MADAAEAMHCWGKHLPRPEGAVDSSLTSVFPPAAPSPPQTKESKSFWKAMMKVHEKLTDINQIKAHNQIKETKLKVGAWGRAGSVLGMSGGRYSGDRCSGLAFNSWGPYCVAADVVSNSAVKHWYQPGAAPPAPLPPLQAFATYLLIAWLTTNIIFAQIVNILSALEWEVRRFGRQSGRQGRWQWPQQGACRAASSTSLWYPG